MQSAEVVQTLQVQIYLKFWRNGQIIGQMRYCLHARRQKRADINIILCALSKLTEIQKCAHAHTRSNLYSQKITAKENLDSSLPFDNTSGRTLSLHRALFSEDKQSDARIRCVSTSTFLCQWVQLSQAGRASNPRHTVDSLWLLLGWRERGNGHQTVTEKALVTSQAVSPLPPHSEE